MWLNSLSWDLCWWHWLVGLPVVYTKTTITIVINFIVKTLTKITITKQLIFHVYVYLLSGYKAGENINPHFILTWKVLQDIHFYQNKPGFTNYQWMKLLLTIVKQHQYISEVALLKYVIHNFMFHLIQSI